MTEEMRARCERALHVLTADGQWLDSERALVFVYEQLGYGPLVAPLRVPPLSWAAALGYRVVARNRRFFARFTFRHPE